MKPFYITLPSGGEGNKTSSFTVNLPYEIDLHGEWEVALVNVLYPTSWYNVYEGNRKVRIYKAKKQDRDDQPPKCDEYQDYELNIDYYKSVDEILTQLNLYLRNFTKKRPASFKMSRDFLYFDANGERASLLMAEDLADMLGNDSNFFRKPVTARLQPSLIMQNLYVYTDDLIEPQIVGDVRAELLCVIPAEERTLKSAIYTPQDLHYLPVVRNNFSSIKIDIRDVRGNHVPFSSGHSVVKLHFRPV